MLFSESGHRRLWLHIKRHFGHISSGKWYSIYLTYSVLHISTFLTSHPYNLPLSKFPWHPPCIHPFIDDYSTTSFRSPMFPLSTPLCFFPHPLTIEQNYDKHLLFPPSFCSSTASFWPSVHWGIVPGGFLLQFLLSSCVHLHGCAISSFLISFHFFNVTSIQLSMTMTWQRNDIPPPLSSLYLYILQLVLSFFFSNIQASVCPFARPQNCD